MADASDGRYGRGDDQQWQEAMQTGTFGAPPPPPPPTGTTGDLPSQPSPWTTAAEVAVPPKGVPHLTGLMAAGFVATALVFGAAGVGVGLAIGGDGFGGGGSVTLPTAARTDPDSSAPIDVAAIANKVEPATVDITARGADGEDEGTGMILTTSGIVLTNNHVVDGSTELNAQVDGQGKIYRATFLGADPGDDVALLQLHDGSGFTTVTLGNSGAITVGDQVVAIGNALALSGPETVTSGTISATGREVTVSDTGTGLQENLKDLFQTTASIAPGNSGGPLVDAAGQVIGMNTASADSSPDGLGTTTIGFAIPINTAMSIARQIQAGKASRNVLVGARPVIGADVETVACAQGEQNSQGQDCSALTDPFSGFPFGNDFGYVSPVSRGAVVVAVDEASPAANGGLVVGDVIVSVDDKPVDNPNQLTQRLDSFKVGHKVKLGWVDQRHVRHTAAIKLVAGPNP